MFRLRIWTRSFDEVGTILRPTAGELLDVGKKLQKDHGAFFRLEYVGEGVICTECGKTMRSVEEGPKAPKRRLTRANAHDRL